MARLKGGRRRGGLLSLVQRQGIYRGFLGDSRGWMVLGAGAWSLRTVKRMAERKPEILLREEIKPGQRLVIANGRATIEGDVLPVVRGRGGKLRPRPAPKATKAPKGRRARKAAKAARG